MGLFLLGQLVDTLFVVLSFRLYGATGLVVTAGLPVVMLLFPGRGAVLRAHHDS